MHEKKKIPKYTFEKMYWLIYYINCFYLNWTVWQIMLCDIKNVKYKKNIYIFIINDPNDWNLIIEGGKINKINYRFKLSSL